MRRWELPTTWPSAAIVFLTIALIYDLVSERRTMGLGWLPLFLVVALLVGIGAAKWRGQRTLVRQLSVALTLLLTVFLLFSTLILVLQARMSQAEPMSLLQDAIVLWTTNVLVFALWYWQIDAGGPDRRAADGYHSTDFVFPQCAGTEQPGSQWAPGLVDYVFLAFTTAMAFGPTDTAVLSRRAKLLMMAQASISLAALAGIAARALNAS
jgi:hypothetical protein